MSWLQFLIDVLSLGSAYALMALGLVIVYGILRLVNFAYGELIMVGGYTMFLVSGSGLPWLVMAICAVIMAIVFGILTDYIAFRPVREKSITAVLITSFALSTLLQNAALLFISPRPRTVPLPEIFSQTVEIAGVITPVRNLVTIAVAVVFLGLFTWLMRSTVLGIAMRAASTHFTMARMLGVPANLIISTAFAISGLIAGIVSLLWIGRIGTVVPGTAPHRLHCDGDRWHAQSAGGRAGGISPRPDRHQLELQSSTRSLEVSRCLHLLAGHPDPPLAPGRSG